MLVAVVDADSTRYELDMSLKDQNSSALNVTTIDHLDDHGERHVEGLLLSTAVYTVFRTSTYDDSPKVNPSDVNTVI
jgi:hypothetical protein